MNSHKLWFMIGIPSQDVETQHKLNQMWCVLNCSHSWLRSCPD